MTQDQSELKYELFKICLSKNFCKFDDVEENKLSCKKTIIFNALLALGDFPFLEKNNNGEILCQ